MTPKQEERIKQRIKKIKSAIAADKRFWGGYYHDGGGMRYALPRLYIQLEDFKGGLRYHNWFRKNFPDEPPFPLLDFQWAIILFYRGRLKEAEQLLRLVISESPFLIDKFLGRPMRLESRKGEKLSQIEHELNQFGYSHEQEKLKKFAGWIESELTEI